ncbi:type II toxin-antitoxin system HicB family antitoxin [Hyphomicrobium nitrativorans]|nr:type II toxin-antitoxin system HicB family antitoxin [Hyphomicrobium nitrativorans]
MKYVGLLDGSGDVWGVMIPDAPGVHGGGATPEEAIADATSALSEVAAMMAAEGSPIANPRPLPIVLADQSVIDHVAFCGATTVMIPLLSDA